MPTQQCRERPIRGRLIVAVERFCQWWGAVQPHQHMQIQPGSRYLSVASQVLIIDPFPPKTALQFHHSRTGRGQDVVQWCGISRGFCSLDEQPASSRQDARSPDWMQVRFHFSDVQGGEGEYTLILTWADLCLTTTCYFHTRDAFLSVISSKSNTRSASVTAWKTDWLVQGKITMLGIF